MKRSTFIRIFRFPVYLAMIAIIAASCGYLQVNPPPDVRASEEPDDKSAWLAAAANMLASAGYGYGRTLQDRAEDIYQDMLEQFGTADAGWTDAALQWWLLSPSNEWLENTYKQVTVIGHKRPVAPWSDPDGVIQIAHLLREGNIVAASISWPDPEGKGAYTGGHVLNCWGDDTGEKKSSNHIPTHLRVTDSYRNEGGILQTYKYDPFQTIEGDGSARVGWFLAYDENKPFIKNIIILSEIQFPEAGNESLFSRMMVDFTNEMDSPAGDMEAGVVTSYPFTSCKSAVVIKDGDAIDGNDLPDAKTTRWLSRWSFSRNEIASGQKLSLVVESSGTFDSWTGISRLELGASREADSLQIPGFSCQINGIPLGSRYTETNASGGYFVFLLTFTEDTNLPGRTEKKIFILKQYPPSINPERPSISISADERMILQSIKAGHSYGYLDTEQQHDFSSWMVNQSVEYKFSGDTLDIPVNLLGLLPFPPGENYGKRIPDTGRKR